MALMKCPECKKEISETVKTCPKCGYDLKKEQNKKKKEELVKQGKEKLNNVKDTIIKYKKYIIIALIALALIIVAYFVIIFIQEKIYENNKSNYPDITMIQEDIKNDIVTEFENITLNDKKLEHEYNPNNVKDVEFYEEYETQVVMKFKYTVDEIISFDIPFIVTYDFDGVDYIYSTLEEHTSLDDYTNVKITSCETIMNDEGLTRENIIQKDYKSKYDSITLKDTKNESDTTCISTYKAKKDGEYIDKNDTIEVEYNLSYSTYTKAFTVKSYDRVNSDITFDLVGKYNGTHAERGDYSNNKNSKFTFEIKEINGRSLTLGSNGLIDEGGYDTYKQSSDSSYVDTTDYDYYAFEIEFRYGSNGTGAKRTMKVRVYDDKLLYYCAHSNDDDTEGCYELTRK